MTQSEEDNRMKYPIIGFVGLVLVVAGVFLAQRLLEHFMS
jgi:hypothetical protein